MRIDVGLASPRLFVTALRGVDRVSELFRFEIDVVADRTEADDADGIDTAALVGQPCHLFFESAFLDDLLGDAHVLHGLVARVQQGDAEERFTQYRITMMPRIAKLAHNASCRIFQDMDASVIATTILEEHGFSKGNDFDFRLSEPPIARPYCVQYRETDWDFIGRILQEDGVFGFFTHDADKETLIWGSEYPVHPNIAGDPEVPFRARNAATSARELVLSVSAGESLVSGGVRLREWNYLQPDLDGQGTFEVETATDSGSPTALEVYDYPGQYAVSSPDGATRAKIRLEQLQSGKRVVHGEATSPRFTAGHVFQLAEHYRDDLNGKYVLLEVYHRISTGAGDTGHDGTIHAYRAEWVAQPREVQFRPPPRGPKPRIPGIQTALVVGPKGEEIHTDDRGRVLLKFHWDRAPDREAPTAWVRVAQMWGSSEWGAYFVPRTDHEVVVAFEDGDPDRPLVVGTVYYGAPPLALPANKTQSTIKSRSTPKGTGSNELRFEDKKDAEELYLHAQKDLTVVVENDANHSAGHDESWTIGNDRVTDVARDDTATIGRHAKIEIAGNLTASVAGTSTINVDKKSAVSLGDASTLDIAKNSAVKVGGATSVEITKALDLSVSDATNATITKALKVKAKTIAIEAEDELTITVGKVSVSLKKNGDVSISAGGKLSIEAQKDMSLESKKSVNVKAGKDAKVEASANVVLKGSKIAGN